MPHLQLIFSVPEKGQKMAEVRTNCVDAAVVTAWLAQQQGVPFQAMMSLGEQPHVYVGFSSYEEGAGDQVSRIVSEAVQRGDEGPVEIQINGVSEDLFTERYGEDILALPSDVSEILTILRQGLREEDGSYLAFPTEIDFGEDQVKEIPVVDKVGVLGLKDDEALVTLEQQLPLKEEPSPEVYNPTLENYYNSFLTTNEEGVEELNCGVDLDGIGRKVSIEERLAAFGLGLGGGVFSVLTAPVFPLWPVLFGLSALTFATGFEKQRYGPEVFQ